LSLPDDGTDYVSAAQGGVRPLRIAYSPRLGNFPVDPRVADVVRKAVSTINAHGIAVEEVELASMPDHNELAALWVRTIAIHYAAIAVHWKKEGTDLLGPNAGKLTPQFRQMLESAGSVSAVEHALDDLLRSQTFDSLQDVFDDYDLIVSPTLAIPPVRNATDGNTIGPVEINGEPVDPLIGWCMTYPLNFTGHPAISVPAGLTPEGLPVGLQIIGRRHADASVLSMAARFEQMQPWFHSYPGLIGMERAA
jgi:amidase/aspartyl-tRNA(Asn)/glutamyl-tRNA(Gln) amidotransferase subunit A